MFSPLLLRKSCALILAALPALALAGCNGQAGKSLEADTAAKPVPVTVAPLERRVVERTVEVVGTLKGWEEVTIGSKRMGRVAKVLHDMGDRVKPGEPLIELEVTDADLAVQQAEKKLQAELAKLGLDALPGKDFDVTKVPSVVQSRVALERAQQNLARERTLQHRGASTVQDLQNSENDEKSAEAALENAVVTARSTLANALASKIALEQSRQARVDMEICAPVPSSLPRGYSGPVVYAVSKRQVSEGQMLKEGEAVCQLVVENPLRLWANVPERFASEVALDQPVRLNVAARPGETFEGRVARINPSIDPSSRTFQVETAVPNAQGQLRPGGFAKASIITLHEGEAVTVPLESVVHFAGVSKIFLADKDKAREVRVETSLEGPGWVEVTGNLPKSAEVVTTGQTQLADGTPIVIRQASADKSPAAVPKTASAKPDRTGSAGE